MKAIICVNNLGFIGLDNGLPWKCSEDLKHFKRLTVGQKLLAGYNTFNSLPNLKDREVFCDIHMNRAFHILDTPEVIERTGNFKNVLSQIDWCIGGKKTYEKYCHLFTELHISRINDNTIGDTTFPDLSNLNKDCVIYTYNFEPDKVYSKLEVIEQSIEHIKKFGRIFYYEQEGRFCLVGRCMSKSGIETIKETKYNSASVRTIFDLSFFKSKFKINDIDFWEYLQDLNDNSKFWVDNQLSEQGNDMFLYLKTKYGRA